MDEPTLPAQLVEARRTPLFDDTTLPDALAGSHRTTAWAEIRLAPSASSTSRVTAPRKERLAAGESAVIVPGVEHHVEPSTDARFYVQFFREPDAAMVPGVVDVDNVDRSGQWTHRGGDLDTDDEIVEMVTRQYVDVVQDDLLQPYFNFGPGFIDSQSHIRTVADYWCHVLLYAPGYEIDIIENHRHLHRRASFTPALLDRWLQVFHDTVDGGWTGPNAITANQRATGMAWAMAQRFLGHGVWRPADRRHDTRHNDRHRVRAVNSTNGHVRTGSAANRTQREVIARLRADPRPERPTSALADPILPAPSRRQHGSRSRRGATDARRLLSHR